MRLPIPIQYLLLAIIVIIALFPIFWIVSTAFKPPQEWFARPVVWITSRPSLDNFAAIFGLPAPSIAIVGGAIVPAQKAFTNSLLAAGTSTVAATFIGFMAAYAISRFRAGGNFMYFFVLATRMLPPVAILIPLLVFFQTLALVDNVLGLIIIYTGIHVAFVIWIVRGFIEDLPADIEEAARLDGVSRWGIVFKIVMPLVKGGIAAAALLIFILAWTEFAVALILTRADAITLPVQLIKYQTGGAGYGIGPMSALSLIAVIPVLVLGYLIQKQMVRGLSMGAIKGRR